MSASVQQVMAEPVQGVAAQSYVMPDMFASPGLTMVPGQLQYGAPTVTYAAVAPAVTYAAAPSVTYAAPAAGSVVYAAPQAGSVTYAAAEPMGSVTYAAPAEQMTYAAPMQTMTYAAPAASYAAPMGGQPVYTISPERFQRIMAGEPLTNEEIAQMTGQSAAPIATQAGGQSFAMPDMFASPGLTMVGGQQGEFSQPAASVSTVAAVEPVSAEAPASAKASDKKKKSDKKSSKKKLSSKKKSKGCC